MSFDPFMFNNTTVFNLHEDLNNAFISSLNRPDEVTSKGPNSPKAVSCFNRHYPAQGQSEGAQPLQNSRNVQVLQSTPLPGRKK